jgi:hypothetical protein
MRREFAVAQHASHPPDAGRTALPTAHNLACYLALRRRDLRPLQQRLAVRGLSSLGRSEAHVLATLDALLALLSVRRTRAPPTPFFFPATSPS